MLCRMICYETVFDCFESNMRQRSNCIFVENLLAICGARRFCVPSYDSVVGYILIENVLNSTKKKRRIRFNYKFPQYAPQAKQSMWRTDWVNQKQSVNQQHLQSELNKNKQFHSSFLANLYVLRQSYYYYYIDCKWA